MAVRTQTEVDKLFASALEGSTSCLGRLLTIYTNYLKLLVTAQLDGRLRARVSPSDIVQETFFEAHRDFPQSWSRWAPRVSGREHLRDGTTRPDRRCSDIANAAMFLASDAASFITGILLPVDGGTTAR